MERLKEQGNINNQSEYDGYTPLMLAVDRDDELASDIALTYSPIHQLLKNYEILFTAKNNITSNDTKLLKE